MHQSYRPRTPHIQSKWLAHHHYVFIHITKERKGGGGGEEGSVYGLSHYGFFLPKVTLLDRVHGCTSLALEVLCKVLRVLDDTNDTPLWRRVHVGHKSLPCLRTVLVAPRTTVLDEEQLLRRVLFKTRKTLVVVLFATRVRSVTLKPRFECLLDTTIVRNVLSKCKFSTDRMFFAIWSRNRVFTVLLNKAVGTGVECLDRGVGPPLEKENGKAKSESMSVSSS